MSTRVKCDNAVTTRYQQGDLERPIQRVACPAVNQQTRGLGGIRVRRKWLLVHIEETDIVSWAEERHDIGFKKFDLEFNQDVRSCKIVLRGLHVLNSGCGVACSPQRLKRQLGQPSLGFCFRNLDVKPRLNISAAILFLPSD